MQPIVLSVENCRPKHCQATRRERRWRNSQKCRSHGRIALTSSRTNYACGVTVVSTAAPDAQAFVQDIAKAADDIAATFGLFFFSQSLFDSTQFSTAIRRGLPGLHHAACSTAGEITPEGLQDGQAIAVLFPAEQFTAVSTLVPDISTTGVEFVAGHVEALKRTLSDQIGKIDGSRVFAICLIDGLSNSEEAVTSAIHWQLDDIPLIGGSAGDELNFRKTSLISGGEACSDAAIVILCATDIPFHVFKTDNFVPTDTKLVVTKSDPDHRVVYELNAGNAAEEYAASVGLLPGDLTPFSFASYPTIVRVGGEHFCRSIQKKNVDGSLSYFCAIDDGVVLSIARPVDMVESTHRALREVDEKLGGTDVVLGFDCVLRRLDAINRQAVRGMSKLYAENHVVGFGTYGEQYQSMHLNQTFTGIAFGRHQRVAGG